MFRPRAEIVHRRRSAFLYRKASSFAISFITTAAGIPL